MEGSAPSARRDSELSNWRQSIRHLWIRIWLAVYEVATLLVVIGLHIVLNHAAVYVVPEGWSRALKLAEATFFGVFMVIYLHSLWKILLIFVPANEWISSYRGTALNGKVRPIRVTKNLCGFLGCEWTVPTRNE
jgi:hypothetical protein